MTKELLELLVAALENVTDSMFSLRYNCGYNMEHNIDQLRHIVAELKVIAEAQAKVDIFGPALENLNKIMLSSSLFTEE